MPLDLGPKPLLGYVGNRLMRHSEERPDTAREAARRADPRARTLVVAGDIVPLARRAAGLDAFFTWEEARALGPTFEEVFIGDDPDDGHRPLFGTRLDSGVVEALKTRADLHITDLRSIAVQGLVAPDVLPMIAEAKAVLAWHQKHGFCSNCGAATRITQHGFRRDCPACGTQHFPRTDPVVIMLAHDGERCVLGRQSRFPPGMYSCLAGFVEPGETIEEAVARETLEEAGVHVTDVRYLASQPWPFPMSLMIGCLARTTSTELVPDLEELEDVRWFSREDVAQMLTRSHPAGLFCPPPVAIAHHLMRAFVEI